MNKGIKDIFVNALSNCTNNVVDKQEIVSVGEEMGLKFPSKMSKSNVVNMIDREGDIDKLYEYFSDRLYIESWVVGKYYGLTSENINDLHRVGVIECEVIKEERFSRDSKCYYPVNLYPFSVLEYDKETLQKAYELSFGQESYRLRIEVQNEEEVQGIVEDLDKVFEITRKAEFYDSSNYAYVSIKKLNNSSYEKNVYRVKINELEDTIDKLKEKHRQETKDLKERVVEVLGLKTFNKFEMMAMRKELEELRRDNECLKKQLKKENGELEVIRNERGAGRKSILSDEDKNRILSMRAERMTMKDIAQVIGCSTSLVHKVIHENK